jgi:hypothetical protein
MAVKKSMPTKINKSLYTESDDRTVTAVLRWLNIGAEKEKRLIRTIEERGEDVESTATVAAMADLAQNDPHVRAAMLVMNLNLIDAVGLPRDLGELNLRRVNAELTECLIFPQVKGGGKKKRVVFWSSSSACSEEKREHQAMMIAIISLHERNVLSAVRQCVCGQWFYAAHGKRRFHTDLCRSRAHYANLSPRAKAHRRKLMRNKMRKIRAAKMREYRALEKERNARALRQAKGVK